MPLLKLGSLDLGNCPACGRKLFPAAYIIRNGQRFHPECFRHKRTRPMSPPAGRRALRPEPRPAPVSP